jgi:hypothetical protein
MNTRDVNTESRQQKGRNQETPEKRLTQQQFAAALAQAEAIEDEPKRAKAFIRVARQLTRGQLSQLLDTVRTIKDEHIFGSVLKALASSFGSTLPRRVLRIANTIEDDAIRADVFLALEPHWKEEEKTAILTRIVARHLTQPEFDRALAEALTILDIVKRARALAELAPHLKRRQLANLLDVVSKFKNDLARSVTLAELAWDLTPKFPESILRAAKTINDERLRTNALCAIEPHLTKKFIPTLLSMVSAFNDDTNKTLFLTEGGAKRLMKHEPAQALAVALKIGDDERRGLTLASLSAHAPNYLAADILEAAKKIRDEDARSVIFAFLSRTLTAEQRVDAMETLNTISDRQTLTRAFAEFGTPLIAVPTSHEPLVAAKSETIEALNGIEGDRADLDRASPPSPDLTGTTDNPHDNLRLPDPFGQARGLVRYDFKLRADVLALVRKARPTWSSDRQSLAAQNIEQSLRAAELGLSVADAFSKAGIVLAERSTEGISIDVERDRALAEFAPTLMKNERAQIWAEAQGVTKRPIRKLTPNELAAIKRHAEKHPWSGRPTHRYSAFQWVQENYGKWIPGLLQQHLKFDRTSLYEAFAKRVSREGLPKWLDVPTEGDAELRNVASPLERAKLLAVRRLNRDRTRAVRSLRGGAQNPKI